MGGPLTWPGTPVAPASSSASSTPTLGVRGAQVRGPWQQRAQAQGASRIQQQQETANANEIQTLNTRMQLIQGLGRARRLIEQDTPTGPLAEEAMTVSRQAPSWARGNMGIPSTQQLTNLGELDKLSTLAATAVAGQTTTGMDASTRAAVRGALFNVDRSKGENERNVNYLLQQYVNDAIAMRVQQAWRQRYGDVNATDSATGMNATDYIAALREQTPTDGPAFEDRNSYQTRVVTPSGASIDLPEVGQFVDHIVHAVRGELDARGNAPQAPPRRPQNVPADARWDGVNRQWVR